MARSLRRLEPVEHAVGTDQDLTVGLYDSAGDAVSVSGATATWKLYRAVPRRGRKPFEGAAVLTKTSAAGDIALASGLATITIADTDLANRSGAYWQVLEVTASGGGITQYGAGPVHLRAGV